MNLEQILQLLAVRKKKLFCIQKEYKKPLPSNNNKGAALLKPIVTVSGIC